MEDFYWPTRCSNSNEQQEESFPHMVNRTRANEGPSGHRMFSYNANNEGASHQVIRDTNFINESYERYLRTMPISSYGDGSGGSIAGLDELYEIDDLNVLRNWGSKVAVGAPSQFMEVGGPPGGSEPVVAAQSQLIGVGKRPEIPLPHDASTTLFVEGLPTNCTRREVSHIFRPFLGYKEVRLVNRESRHSWGDPVVFCFVDFQSPAHASAAMDALQGYIFDENDRDSSRLRLQFARSPGARSGIGYRGKR